MGTIATSGMDAYYGAAQGERKKIRNGRRFVATGGQGGARPQHAEERVVKWLHPDAKPARQQRVARAVQRARAV